MKTSNNVFAVALHNRLLDPLVILGSLYASMLAFDERLNGYYLVLGIITFFICSYVFEQVDQRRSFDKITLWTITREIIIEWIIIVAVILFMGVATGLAFQFSEPVIEVWFVIAPLALIATRSILQKINANLNEGGGQRSAVIVGVNEVGLKLARRTSEYHNVDINVHGFFDDRDISRQTSAEKIQPLGGMADIAAYVRQHNINIIYISQPISAQPRILQLLEDLQDTTASIYFLPDIYVFDLIQPRFDYVGGMPVVAICESPFTGIDHIIKRSSDIVLALAIQILLLPIMLCIALAVKLTSPGPVIFKQRRYGLDGEEIMVYKFRSMAVCDDGDNIVQATKGDLRVTKLGGFLRRTSLDELPQFINVLQGRMSIVGPRPHAVAHNELYRKQIKGYMLRHKVRPGITGWAQVNGSRGETDTLDKMKTRIDLDLDYLRRWSLMLDLSIIFKTVMVVLKRENAH
ncbi:undecaprenyl-phosphate glucose phosphotransferase [Undibacterium sp.]|uniref:undecaprenyl-phosphate glucose phosphotransferase n=1 Tax=Undibacterium sp. TaxID=1914977 RepID=UPI0025F72D17|nr:undecaprenyl-phosphate glucose phosphotransferase [Undibacterium sp.]MCX7221246.1 undecaprenyl-phosphate glucose phosphotransferase [Burkholderiales bacterium]